MEKVRVCGRSWRAGGARGGWVVGRGAGGGWGEKACYGKKSHDCMTLGEKNDAYGVRIKRYCTSVEKPQRLS